MAKIDDVITIIASVSVHHCRERLFVFGVAEWEMPVENGFAGVIPFEFPQRLYVVEG